VNELVKVIDGVTLLVKVIDGVILGVIVLVGVLVGVTLLVGVAVLVGVGVGDVKDITEPPGATGKSQESTIKMVSGCKLN
jgi:hypothetical protein